MKYTILTCFRICSMLLSVSLVFGAENIQNLSPRQLTSELQKCIQEKLDFIKANDAHVRLPRILDICSQLRLKQSNALSQPEFQQKKALEEELGSLAQSYLKELPPSKVSELQKIKDRYQEIQKQILELTGNSLGNNQGQKHCIELIFI